MAATDINGTYEYMYLVTPDEKDHGATFRWDLVNDGSGNDAINPVATNVTISGAPPETGAHNSTQFSIDVAGGDQFIFTGSAETTTFGHGFIVEDKTSGQFYFVTNTEYQGAANPAAASLSVEHADPIAPCFVEGVRIATRDGEALVEDLRIGDEVRTADGRVVPIAWIGRRVVSRRFADPLRTLPIRIKKDAFEHGTPSRDLLLSADHAVFLDGALFQAGTLVNGSSIVRDEGVPMSFTYYHVELDDHSLILAENAPAETFVDNVDRLAFDNWAEHESLYPGGKAIAEMPYARAKAARQVPKALSERLAARAAALYGPVDVSVRDERSVEIASAA